MDRDDALQRLRRLPGRLHPRGDQLVHHGPEAHEPDEGGAPLMEREDAPAEPLLHNPGGLPSTKRPDQPRGEAMEIAWRSPGRKDRE